MNGISCFTAMQFHSYKLSISCFVFLLAAVIFPSFSFALELDRMSGHLKYDVTQTHYPDNSVYYLAFGDSTNSHIVDSRFNLLAHHNNWEFQADYQLSLIQSDSLQVQSFLGVANPDDDQRLFDLTHELSGDDDTRLQHRLDRFSIGYSTEKTVVRLGRQVLSFGNGFFYNPLDFLNPFDPAALDKEYKAGDDMLYGQYLFDSGADLQAVWVARRDINRQVDQSVATQAIKYHGWLFDTKEIDILLARHFDDNILGLGFSTDLGEAVWRSDLMITDIRGAGYSDTVTSFVTNLAYSWVWAEKNLSGMLEYFFNGFGDKTKDYSLLDLAGNQSLYARLARGELYSMGKHYMAGSVSIELSPLWIFTPALFANLQDSSGMLQLGISHSFKQDIQLQGAINKPFGGDGTEFGGIYSLPANTPAPINPTFATDFNVYFQIAWYF